MLYLSFLIKLQTNVITIFHFTKFSVETKMVYTVTTEQTAQVLIVKTTDVVQSKQQNKSCLICCLKFRLFLFKVTI